MIELRVWLRDSALSSPSRPGAGAALVSLFPSGWSIPRLYPRRIAIYLGRRHKDRRQGGTVHTDVLDAIESEREAVVDECEQCRSHV